MILNRKQFFEGTSLTRMVGFTSLTLLLIAQTACQSTTVAERYNSKTHTPVAQEEPAQKICTEITPDIEVGDAYEDPSVDLNKYKEEISSFDGSEDGVQKMNEEIRRLLGTRYRYGGTDENRGLDCSGFVSKVFNNAIGMKLPHSSVGMAELGEEVDKSEMQFGDLVFFKIRKKRISHVGIYVGDGKFVHATRGAGVMYSSLNEEYYRRTYARSRRVVTMQDLQSVAESSFSR
ncbi:MAG: C40 family peptidase [Chlorobiales bacterium]|nr:C40 family peptidase [Chlorobiales bacterium]